MLKVDFFLLFLRPALHWKELYCLLSSGARGVGGRKHRAAADSGEVSWADPPSLGLGQLHPELGEGNCPGLEGSLPQTVLWRARCHGLCHR